VSGPTSENRQPSGNLVSSRQNPELMRAGHALVANDLPTAEGILRNYLKQRPTDVAAIRMMAELAARVGRLVDAENLLRRALELDPSFTAARTHLAVVLHKQNRHADAIAVLEQVDQDSDSDLSHASLKAASMSRVGRMDEARLLYDQVIKSRPDEPKVWMSYGHILKTVGEQAECIAAYRKAVEIMPTLGEAWWSLANLKTVKLDNDDIAAMEQALNQPGLAREDCFHLHFALGKAYEDKGQPHSSFDHFAEGNRLRRQLIDYSPDRHHRNVDRAIAFYTPAFFAAREGQGCQVPDPIFILGLPRAGSTLVEQILASHPAVEGTAELPDIPTIVRRLDERDTINDAGLYPECLAERGPDELKALGEEYLELASVQRFTDRPFFVDKLPNNWLHVGFIRTILPKAKIIDARRHPLACGYSNFKQHYARGQRFSYDLAEIGAYYADYARLMRHFDAVLPGYVHRVIHEELVDDPEREVRRLLDFLGLSFDPACLAFHENPRAVRTASSEQVRRPINRDGFDQWKPLEAQLEPLKSALGAVLQDWHR